MRLLTCEDCPHDKANKTYGVVPLTACPKKERVRKVLKGNGIQWTAIQFRCSILKDELSPGLIVDVNIHGYEDGEETWYEYEGTVIAWKGRKVLVWIHEPDEYLNSKWDVVKVWPKNINIPAERVFEPICEDCKRPVNRPRTRVPKDELGVEMSFYCESCKQRTGE